MCRYVTTRVRWMNKLLEFRMDVCLSSLVFQMSGCGSGSVLDDPGSSNFVSRSSLEQSYSS